MPTVVSSDGLFHIQNIVDIATSFFLVIDCYCDDRALIVWSMRWLNLVGSYGPLGLYDNSTAYHRLFHKTYKKTHHVSLAFFAGCGMFQCDDRTLTISFMACLLLVCGLKGFLSLNDNSAVYINFFLQIQKRKKAHNDTPAYFSGIVCYLWCCQEGMIL